MGGKISEYTIKETLPEDIGLIHGDNTKCNISFGELFEMIGEMARSQGLTVQVKDDKIMFIKGEINE